jgi:Protein of unknown function (DUF3224)
LLGKKISPAVGEPKIRENDMTEIMKTRAFGRAETKYQKVTPYNQQNEGPILSNLELTESFHGDIEGENQARSLVALRSDGSGIIIGFSRVVGKVGGKSGSFVLQANVTITKKHADGKWSVVPSSSTGELRGLLGDGGFITELGQPAEIWLDYWFE